MSSLLCGNTAGAALLFQARLQQELSKGRPAAPPPSFSAQAAGSRAPEESGASAKVTAVANAIPPASTSAAVHITSAASSLTNSTDRDRLPRPVVSDKSLPVSENQVTAAQQLGPDLRLLAASSEQEYTDDTLPAKSSVVGVKRPKQKGSGQNSLEYVRLMTCMHAMPASMHVMPANSASASASQVYHLVDAYMQTQACMYQPHDLSSLYASLSHLSVACQSMRQTPFAWCIDTCVPAVHLCLALLRQHTRCVWHAEDDDEPR